MHINVLYIALAAFGGGILAAILGWLDSIEAFNTRKFAASVVRSLFAALIFTLGSIAIAQNITWVDIITAILGGAGVDALGNRISGAIKSGAKGGTS